MVRMGGHRYRKGSYRCKGLGERAPEPNLGVKVMRYTVRGGTRRGNLGHEFALQFCHVAHVTWLLAGGPLSHVPKLVGPIGDGEKKTTLSYQERLLLLSEVVLYIAVQECPSGGRWWGAKSQHPTTPTTPMIGRKDHTTNG